MIKGLISLAFGALTFGVLEFVAMGLLPYVAQDFSISIAEASHTVSIYAIGVCVGVVYMMFTRSLNLKVSLLITLVFQLIAIVVTALAPDFTTLLFSRFLSGLPHGCFFGLASIIATRITSAKRATTAMAIMIAGQTLANVFGVPLGTALAYSVSWRLIFWIMAVWGVVVIFAVWRWLPDTGAMEDHGFKSQFRFLKLKAPYLVALSILLGNGGIFCLLSYVSPVLTDYIGLPLALVPTILVASGTAMMIFNLISGRIADSFTPGKVSSVIFVMTLLCMAIAFIWKDPIYLSVGAIIICIGLLSGLGPTQSLSILRTAPGGELIGVAFGQVAYNFGNAIGAIAGSVPLDLGFNAQYCILTALVLTTIGTVFMFIYTKYHEKNFLTSPSAESIATK